MSKSNNAELYESAGITPELSPITEAFRFVGLGVQSIKRLAATDPDFPPLIRLSSRKTLVDVTAVAAYLRAQAGKAPRSIRDEAEQPAKRRLAAAAAAPAEKN